MRVAGASRRHRRQDQCFGTKRRQPAGVAIDVCKLRAADFVVVQDGVRRARHHSEPMTLEYGFRLVAPVRQKAWRSSLDCPFADGCSLRQDSFGIELMAPAGHVADSPG